MKNGLWVTLAAVAALTGCPSDPVVTPDAPAGRLRPPLTVGSTSSNMPANLACPDRAEPEPGTPASHDFRLVARGLTTTDIFNGAFEIWQSNVVGTDCAATADCIELTSGADADSLVVSADVDADFYAYRVPANSVAMTYTALGYNFIPDDGENTVTTIPVSIFMTAITLIRSGMMADPVDGILTGDVSDCDGRGMRGVTTRLFGADGAEITAGTGAMDFGQAYRAGGALPDSDLPETDYSGGYAMANIPIVGDGRVAVVAYGTTTEGGEVDVIACEQVTVGTNAITILSMGPYRADYEAGNLCLDHAPTP